MPSVATGRLLQRTLSSGGDTHRTLYNDHFILILTAHCINDTVYHEFLSTVHYTICPVKA